MKARRRKEQMSDALFDVFGIDELQQPAQAAVPPEHELEQGGEGCTKKSGSKSNGRSKSKSSEGDKPLEVTDEDIYNRHLEAYLDDYMDDLEGDLEGPDEDGFDIFEDPELASLFEATQVGGWPIGGQHHLRTLLLKGVEGVEELFLCRLFALQELDVIEQQDVDVSVAIAHCAPCARALAPQRRHKVVDEARRRRVEHALVGLPELKPDRVQQVSLADADAAVDEQRVKGCVLLGHRQRRAVGKPVRAADHEAAEVERVHQVVARRGDLSSAGVEQQLLLLPAAADRRRTL